MDKKHKLIETCWPEFGACKRPPRPSADEFQGRIDAVLNIMKERKLTHIVVYADREHFANMAYLTGFDPRFEEALLIISPEKTPLLVVGNECEGYLAISPLYNAGMLRHERFQPFSLLNQPRNNSRFLSEIFSKEGINRKSAVGCIGSKYFSSQEHPSGALALDIPAYIADTLRGLTGRSKAINITDIFMHPDYGLRTFCSPAEIAYFEYTNILASEGMKRIITGMREGMEDHELIKLAGYNGEPLGCHMTLVTGANRNCGLSGPIGAKIRRGGPFASNICYWGSNTCRAGWLAKSAKDLPANTRGYITEFAGPYFEAMNGWFRLLKIGTPGGIISNYISEKLPYGKFEIFLNAGHLIHLDEWVSSPIYPGSKVKIHSGMVMQADVIPSSDQYFSTRMEDGYVIADEALRQRIRKQFPDTYQRCRKRREFMSGVLGINLPEEVLPLSNMPAIVPPFMLRPETILAMD
ncbi:MAG: hypothetical protein HZA48_10565 [Planctomycetes bacterium]|nr:hypothetical protein [Planctomycetota bacterium]